MNELSSTGHVLLAESLRAPLPYMVALPMGMYACDADGQILWFNQRAEELWGRAPVLGPEGDRYCGSYRIVNPAGEGFIPARDCPMGVALREGRNIAGREVSIERPDGSRGAAIVHIEVVKDSAGKVLGAINCFQDVTEIKEREKRFTDILNSLPVAVYTTDRDGRITYFNDAAEKLAGRRPTIGVDEWCVSWRLYDSQGNLLPHDQCPMAVALKEQREVRGARAYAERPDGSRVPFAPYPTPLRNGAGHMIGAVNALVDLTELDRANDQVRQRTQDILDFFENGAIALHLVGGDGTIREANQAELDLLGYTRDEYIGRNIREFHADQDVIADILAKLSVGRKLDKYPARLIAKDGSLKHVLITSNVQFRDDDFIHTRCFTYDITQSKVAELELYRHHQRLAATYEGAAVGIAETDEQGRFIRINESMCAITGYTRQDLLQQALFDHLHPDDRAATRTSYGKLVAGEIKRYDIDKRFLHKDGRTIWIAGTCTAVRDEDGRFLFGVRIVQDVTARKALYHFTESLNAAPDLAAVYESALEALTSSLRCQRASILLFDDQGRMKFVAHRGLSAAYRNAVEGHSPWNRDSRNPQPIFVPDIDASNESESLKATVRSEGIGALAFIPLTVDGRIIGKFMTYCDAPRAFGEEDAALAMAIAQQLALAIARQQAVQALKVREAQERARAAELQAIMEAVPNPIWIARDPDCRAIFGNPAADRMLGTPPGSNHSFSAPEEEHPKGYGIYSRGRKLDLAQMPVQRAARGEEVRDMEMDVRFSDGTVRSLLGNAAPMRESDGRVRGCVAAFIDITERLKSERQRDLLAAELSHRVKNTLATVMSILHHSYAKAASPEAARKSFEARLLALAHTHTRLGEGEWTGVALRTLIDDELSPYVKDDKSNLVLSGPALTVGPRAAVSLGMAFHELATNAAKYGALSTADGEIEVYWTLSGGAVHLDWIERNGPKVENPTRRGFGRFLIERGVARDFNGKVELQFVEEGLCCRMVLPLGSQMTVQQVRA